ncbi:MAG: NUDIX hydrolase [Verrucomicrobiota bacterium]
MAQKESKTRQPSLELDLFQEGLEPGWRRLRSETVFDHRYLRLEEIEYATPAHPEGGVHWIVARRKSAIALAPELADGRFLLIRQERMPVELTLWEFPAGQIDEVAQKEDPAVIRATAAKELEEETGYQLGAEGRLEPLGYFFSSQGFTDEHVYLFHATGLKKLENVTLGAESEMIHEAKAFTWAEIGQLIARNEIRDGNSLALYARMAARRAI